MKKKDFYKEVKLDAGQMQALTALKNRKEFHEFASVVEMVIQSRLWSLVDSSDLSREEQAYELADIEGAHNLWRYINYLMSRSEKKLQDLSEENKKDGTGF